ncbi:MAG: glycerophosphodiester phosphodiesterase family protein [Brachymonas sp.]
MSASARPLIIGHRGACGYLPEHTLQSYQLAIDMGADFIEPDLVATKDGVLIARHEPCLGESTDIASRAEFASRRRSRVVDGVEIHDWFACDLSWAEVQTLRARQIKPEREQSHNGLYGIPSYAQILELAARESARLGRSIGTYPETKHPSWHRSIGLPLEEKLLAQLAAYGYSSAAAPVIIQSFESGNLRALRGQTGVRLMQLIDEKPQQASWLSAAGLAEMATYANGIGPWKGHILGAKLLANFVDYAHAAGLFVHPWTFRNEPPYWVQGAASAADEYAQFFAAGVDGVFSDFADSAVAARQVWL